jgi:hypothetical protein
MFMFDQYEQGLNYNIIYVIRHYYNFLYSIKKAAI